MVLLAISVKVAAEISVGDVAVSGDGYCRAEGTVFDIPLGECF